MGHVHIRTLMDGIGTYTWVLEGTMYVSLGEHKLATYSTDKIYYGTRPAMQDNSQWDRVKCP